MIAFSFCGYYILVVIMTPMSDHRFRHKGLYLDEADQQLIEAISVSRSLAVRLSWRGLVARPLLPVPLLPAGTPGRKSKEKK